ncbi:MAG: single-stranded DNA-binding protein [Candidatus Lindowbacteria bacterium]|nr:single-stranded DNA-binding protein [Candidatus Lindowbacteria bacterium]
MSDFNLVVLGGRLVANPELRFTSKGTAVASLRVASNRFFKVKSAGKEGSGKSEFKEKVLFINVEAFGRNAEKASKNRKRGDQLMIRGRLELDEWTGNDGKARQTYQIYAEEIRFNIGTNKNTTLMDGSIPRESISENVVTETICEEEIAF